MNIYLNIDGIINDTFNQKEPVGLRSFLQFVIDNHSPFWITPHSRDGSVSHLYHYLSSHLNPDVFALSKDIKPIPWDSIKTDGIDFSKPFLWFNPTLLEKERETLEAHHVLNRYMEVDLKNNPNNLVEHTQYLQTL